MLRVQRLQRADDLRLVRLEDRADLRLLVRRQVQLLEHLAEPVQVVEEQPAQRMIRLSAAWPAGAGGV